MKVEVEGLRPFLKELRSVDRELPRLMRVASKEAGDVVGDATKASYSSRGGSAPKVTPTVKVLATQRGASVRVGGGSSVGGKVAHGNEFGALRWKQFPRWLGSGEEAGYSLWPSVRQNRDRVAEVYGDAVDRAMSNAFPD